VGVLDAGQHGHGFIVSKMWKGFHKERKKMEEVVKVPSFGTRRWTVEFSGLSYSIWVIRKMGSEPGIRKLDPLHVTRSPTLSSWIFIASPR
jgi:hypothetical protein